MSKNELSYFYLGLPVATEAVAASELAPLVCEHAVSERPAIIFFRQLAPRLTTPVSGGFLSLCATHQEIQRHIIDRHTKTREGDKMLRAAKAAGFPPASDSFVEVAQRFCHLFPGADLLQQGAVPDSWVREDTPAAGHARMVLVELLLLALAAENPAFDTCRQLLDDRELDRSTTYRLLVQGVEQGLADAGPVPGTSLSLPQLLRAPIKACPTSLAGQLAFMRDNWRELLPPELLARLQISLDLVQVEESRPMGGAGLAQMLRFDRTAGSNSYPEYEGYSPDTDWMPNVVMVAKMTYVWLDQLGKTYGRPVERLDQIPDEELDRLARWGFTALWLIGVWERSPASQRIKQLNGNPDAMASAYSLYDYEVAQDLGGEGSLADLRQRCQARGIRLASDMVPNHTGLHSRWIVEHPDWFVQLDYPPYPVYTFNGADLSASPEVSLHLEDGYWDRRDAAVVFKHYDHRSSRTRYIYHGNDGTSTPWNDTAQLNYLLPEVRQAVMETILHVARLFPIIRFDAAMTLAKKHYQRLWYPQPGHGGIPSRAEHGMTREEFDAAFPKEFWREVVDRVAVEAPGTLLLAEAFWLMEGYFVRTLGMHRVYNSAFMNMLKMEENAKYRQTVKNVLEFDPRILQRFVNFMNNPDERTAVEQFGKEDKYLGACMLLVTMPGLPMFGHGQVEGFHEKYGMEYRRACWDEPVDQHLVWLHETRIFPLMKRRYLFSGSERFRLFDFWCEGYVDENVFAYSNGQEGERALVVFHNRYADTDGWLHLSAAQANPGQEELTQTTLAASLGIEGGHDCFCRFCDQVTGLQYLLPADDLLRQGLHLHLGPYQHQVFWDFATRRDSADEPWGQLCRRLGGTPVADLDRELIQVCHAPLITAWGDLLEACRRLLNRQAPLDDEQFSSLAEPCRRAASLVPGAEPPVDACRKLQSQLALFLPPMNAAATVPPAPSSHSDSERLLFMVWALCHALHIKEPGSITALGLDRPLAAAFATAGETTGQPEHLTPEETVSLVQALLALQGVLPQEEQAATFFAVPWCASFLKLHESGGYSWFSKERFELLMQWLVLVSAWREGAPHDLAELQRRAAALSAKAARSGYRRDRFEQKPEDAVP
jgi:glycosidase